MTQYAVFPKGSKKPVDELRFDSKQEAEKHFESEGGDYDCTIEQKNEGYEPRFRDDPPEELSLQVELGEEESAPNPS